MRLGDLDVLKAQLKKLPMMSNWGEAFIPRLIDEQPTIDAVPVVRCRECKFYREHRTKRYKQMICQCVRMARHDMEYPVKPDDFCSYGQRKEDEHEAS